MLTKLLVYTTAMPDSNILILQKETLCALIRNSVGSTTFRSVMAKFKDSGEIKDILEDGELSCAFFVSSLLTIAGYMDRPKATVSSMHQFLREHHKWIDVHDSKEGDIVVWREMTYPSGDRHAHIGFLLGPDAAISTDYQEKCVTKHSISEKGREVESVYRLD